jgi:RimJ/RimL family protein N-acetyltransferase
MKTLLALAAECVGQVILAVEAGNLRAIKSYQRLGFRAIGKIPRSILVDGKYFEGDFLFLA